MKELIYLDEKALSPAGGPLGVGYYIYEEAKKASDQEIYFLSSDAKAKENEAKQKEFLYKFPRITKIVRSIRHIREYRKMIYAPSNVPGRFDEYDIVHFHSTIDMYKQRKSLEGYKGKIILTSHSPIPLTQELYAACATKFERHFFEKKKAEFEKNGPLEFYECRLYYFPLSRGRRTLF